MEVPGIFFYKLRIEALATGLPAGHIYFTFLDKQKIAMDNIFIFVSLTSFIIIFFGGLYLSHKVAGPIYQLTNHLKIYNKNNIPPLNFRKGDYFIEIQESFNEFIKK